MADVFSTMYPTQADYLTRGFEQGTGIMETLKNVQVQDLTRQVQKMRLQNELEASPAIAGLLQGLGQAQTPQGAAPQAPSTNPPGLTQIDTQKVLPAIAASVPSPMEQYQKAVSKAMELNSKAMRDPAIAGNDMAMQRVSGIVQNMLSNAKTQYEASGQMLGAKFSEKDLDWMRANGKTPQTMTQEDFKKMYYTNNPPHYGTGTRGEAAQNLGIALDHPLTIDESARISQEENRIKDDQLKEKLRMIREDKEITRAEKKADEQEEIRSTVINTVEDGALMPGSTALTGKYRALYQTELRNMYPNASPERLAQNGLNASDPILRRQKVFIDGVMPRLDMLEDKLKATKPEQFPTMNAFRLWWAKETGQPDSPDLQSSINNIIFEIARAEGAGGAMSDLKTKIEQGNLNPNLNAAQFHAIVNNSRTTLQSMKNAIDKQFDTRRNESLDLYGKPMQKDHDIYGNPILPGYNMYGKFVGAKKQDIGGSQIQIRTMPDGSEWRLNPDGSRTRVK